MSLQEEYQEFEQQERPDGPAHYFGPVTVDIYDGVLVKGQGVQPYDPATYREGERRVKVSRIVVQPITRNGGFAEFPIDRKLVPFDNGWLKIVKPSLARLNVSLPMINGAWAHVQMTPDGRTYKNRNGEDRQSSTIEFMAIFDNEAAARVAASEYFASLDAGQNTTSQPAEPTQYAPNGEPGNEAERNAALHFIPTFASAAKGDINEMAKMIANNPIIGKYFTVNSPEVQKFFTPVPEPATIPY